MANSCFYTMYAEGKPAAIDELIARMTFNYDHSEESETENRVHFWRVFDAEAEDLEPRSEGTRLVVISGDCAWSVRSCMCDGPLTYASDFTDNPKVAPYCTSLKKTSNELDIEIEVFSEEPAMEFAEHYHYVPNGQAIEEDCELQEIWWDRDEYETFAWLDAKYGLSGRGITEEDFADEEYVVIGGFRDLTPFCYQKAIDDGKGFAVELTRVGDKKVAVIKAIRALTGLGLKEAYETAKKTPNIIMEGATKEDAEAAKKQLEEVGATVTLK